MAKDRWLRAGFIVISRWLPSHGSLASGLQRFVESVFWDGAELLVSGIGLGIVDGQWVPDHGDRELVLGFRPGLMTGL